MPRLSEDVSPSELAKQVDDVCGRDIKNAVIDAAVRAARRGAAFLSLADFLSAVDRNKAARIRHEGELTAEERVEIEEQIRTDLAKRNGDVAGS